jgi:hypothetical protein
MFFVMHVRMHDENSSTLGGAYHCLTRCTFFNLIGKFMNQKFEVVVFNEDLIGQVIGIYDTYEQAEKVMLQQQGKMRAMDRASIQEVFIKND